MTYATLRQTIGALLEQPALSAFVSNGVDLLDVAINNAKNWAQQRYDFEYSRTVVSVSVNPSTGGDLTTAVEVGTGRSVRVKKIENAFLSYQGSTNRPVRFISKKGQTADAGRRYGGLPYAPSVASPLSSTQGRGESVYPPTLVQQGQSLFLYPDSTGLFNGADATVYLDVVEWLPDFVQAGVAAVTGGSLNYSNYTSHGGTFNGMLFWFSVDDGFIWYNSAVNQWWITSLADFGNLSAADYYSLASTLTSPSGTYTSHGGLSGAPVVTVFANTVSSFLLDYGAEFLMWRAVVEGNYLFEEFVFRQEGALAPPEKQAENAFRALLDWDAGIVGSNTSEFDLE